MNLQSTDFSKKYCDRVNHTVRKDNKKELKKTELKNNVVDINFEKADIDLRKNKKSHNLIDVKPSSSKELRKPYVFKKRIVGRSKNYNLICYNNRINHLPENHNCIEFCGKQDHKKNYQNNCQLNNEKSDDQRDKSVRVVTPLNDSGNADQRSNSIFFTTQNKEQLYDRSVKCHDIKTMIINRGTKYTTGQHLQYTDDSIQNYKMKNFNDYHDKHNWGFYSHNGQNTYSINNGFLNKAENPRRNKYIRNSKPIIESFHKTEYDKSLVYIGSKYTDQDIAKNQKLNSDVMDINLNPLSNSTFISTINLQKLQENKHNNNKISTSKSKMFVQTYNIQNYTKTINNSSAGLSYDQNKQEDKIDPKKYYLKCEKTKDNYAEENVNWTKKINLYKNKENIKYYNNENNENNYNDIKSIGINNLEMFTAYFDKSKFLL
ncbi:probable serine/threonine-protein kinase clkA [Metopolophium dirhodum]|uniref:probable serine/threonine-protein kinase clkA n=1 Tax=Metopolophium dirhodum TaxID=44670 RepID=UPI00298FFB9E|nr:probable serine/threonine-protein kinase clkA [Metopolophium dirhodum]